MPNVQFHREPLGKTICIGKPGIGKAFIILQLSKAHLHPRGSGRDTGGVSINWSHSTFAFSDPGISSVSLSLFFTWSDSTFDLLDPGISSDSPCCLPATCREQERNNIYVLQVTSTNCQYICKNTIIGLKWNFYWVAEWSQSSTE